MSSRSRTNDGVERVGSGATPPLRALALSPVLAIALAGAAGCQREQREFSGPGTDPSPAVATSTLHPGETAPPTPDPHGPQYENNAYHINQGERLYRWFNCNGCHAAGGGDIGPALMDDEWRYGGSIDQIAATILQGRPNGMPSFRGKIPEAQVWEIAAYVRALSGNVPKDAAPSRSDSLSNTPPLTQLPKQPPKSEAEPQQ
ncbi:MAG TPA: cytochrome c [Rudaea sp.]